MTTTIQTVTLTSEAHYGRLVPPKAFGELLRVIPDAIRFSIRMAFESRSQAKGKRPAWLEAAADIRFLDHEGDDKTIMHFQAPRLGEAADVLYRQRELWPTRPRPEDTGFDLLGDVITDVASGNADSDRFDRKLLEQIERFKRGLNGSFQRLEMTGTRFTAKRPAVITPDVIQTAARLFQDTPEPQQSRLVGKLDMIRDSTNSFAIKLQDGQEIRGVLTEGEVSRIAPLFRQDVLVLGKAIYRPSGKLLRIDAEEIVAAGEGDQFFSVVPQPSRTHLDVRDVLREQQHKKGIAAIFGKWPGTETDEEIANALRELG